MGAPVEARLSPDTLVVYPTALKAEAVLHGAARAGRVLLGHRLTTFPELTDALARDLGVTARTLGPEMAAVVVAHALDQAPLPEELRGRGRGLVGELLGVMEELCAGGLDPDDVLALEAALAPGPTRRRVGAIARVYGAYAAGLARLGAVDRRGRERLVCDRLAAAERRGERPASLAGVRRLVFAELYDFSVLQFLIATSLIRMVGDAELVMLAHPENVDATRFVDRTWNRFVGDAEIADQALPSFVVRGGRQGSLAAALGGVFATDRPAPLPGDGSIRLVEAPGRYGEVEAVGRELRRQLADGARPERLAILARDMGRYAALIDDVRRRFRLPIHFRRGEPLLGTPLVKAVVGLLRCAAEGVPRPGLETVLTQDYFRAGGMTLVRCLRRAGYVDAAVRSLDACLAHAVEKRRDGPGRARLLAAGARLQRVVAHVAALGRRRTVAAHVTALRRALRALGFRPLPPDALLERAGRRDAAAWGLLDETLDALGGVTTALGAGPVSLGDFLGTLLAALEPLALPDPAPRAGSIHALGVLDARGLDFDTVYLLGLDDGTFPAAHPENPILPDAARRELAPHAAAIVRRRLGPRGDGLPLGGLLRTAREAALEDPFLFFLALSTAEQSLVMTVPLVDERGNPTVRSPFVDEVAACLTDGIPIETASATSVVPPAADCAEPQELIARAALDRWTGVGAGSPRPGAAVAARRRRGAARRHRSSRRDRAPA